MDGGRVDSGQVVARARALLELGRADEAVAILGPAAVAEPDNAELWYLLAHAYAVAGDIPRILDAAAQAVAADPTEPRAFRAVSIGHFLAGDRDRAVTAAREAVRLGPDDWTVHQWLAVILAEGSDPAELAEAETGARHAVELAPDDPETHLTLGKVLRRKGDTHPAELAFRQVLALDPQHGEAMRQLGLIRADRDDVGDAVDWFRAAIRADPRDQRARHDLETRLWQQIGMGYALLLCCLGLVGLVALARRHGIHLPGAMYAALAIGGLANMVPVWQVRPHLAVASRRLRRWARPLWLLLWPLILGLLVATIAAGDAGETGPARVVLAGTLFGLLVVGAGFRYSALDTVAGQEAVPPTPALAATVTTVALGTAAVATFAGPAWFPLAGTAAALALLAAFAAGYPSVRYPRRAAPRTDRLLVRLAQLGCLVAAGWVLVRVVGPVPAWPALVAAALAAGTAAVATRRR